MEIVVEKKNPSGMMETYNEGDFSIIEEAVLDKNDILVSTYPV
jgi:hypothetical protein